MGIDRELSLALQRYSSLRRGIARRIAAGVPELPYPGSRDMLEWIGRLHEPNVTELATALEITRGGASKGLSKLRCAGLADSFQREENRREVFARLTPAGEAALRKLQAAWDNLHTREAEYLSTLPEDNKRVILQFLEGFSAHLSLAMPAKEDVEQ